MGKMKEKLREKNEEIELNQRMHEEEAQKKAAKNETMQLKNQAFLDEQKEMKQRWYEQEKGNILKKENQSKAIAIHKNEEKERNKRLQEESDKMKIEMKENLLLKNKYISDHQDELRKRWVEYEEDDNFYIHTKQKEKLNKKNDEKEMKKLVKEEEKKITNIEKNSQSCQSQK